MGYVIVLSGYGYVYGCSTRHLVAGSRGAGREGRHGVARWLVVVVLVGRSERDEWAGWSVGDAHQHDIPLFPSAFSSHKRRKSNIRNSNPKDSFFPELNQIESNR
jgi:hypothetical protein